MADVLPFATHRRGSRANRVSPSLNAYFKPPNGRHTLGNSRYNRFAKRLCLVLLLTVLGVLWVRRNPNIREKLVPGIEKQFSTSLPEEIQAAYNVSLQPVTTRKIPKIVHFVYGLKAEGPTLDLVHYLAIKSAHDVLKPERIYFHYHYMPTGHYFEAAKTFLTLHQVEIPTKVFDRPVDKYAHRADIVRMDMLLQYGGIYLDLDVITLKPFDNLLDETFVMGQEGRDGWVGLCNAVILARPQAHFLQRWRATYQFFDQSDWNYHSVALPGKLSEHFGNEIKVLPYTSFFWPLWDKNGLRTMYLEKTYDFRDNLAVHLWESAANTNLLRDIDEEVMANVESSVFCQLRRFLPQATQNLHNCTIPKAALRSDTLVGYWTAPKSAKRSVFEMTELSGNQLHGMVRSGRIIQSIPPLPMIELLSADAYIYLSPPISTTFGELSVSWWMAFPSIAQKAGAVVCMIHSDYVKLYVETEIDSNQQLALNIRALHLESPDASMIRAGTLERAPDHTISIADQGPHHFALSISAHQNTLSLYQDARLVLTTKTWAPPHPEATVRGIWLGGAEPETSNYQDAWDGTKTLVASFSDISLWSLPLSESRVNQVFHQGRRLDIVDN
ncbi:hypothetical protein BZG36_00117 [Bifiguratus adelaidae]|uniref:Alpha 1,4-glycosyltransferase domain-containing protein n=1 Tax=Bifiguratus adelaidae TaxID=1938954 RepID=A0A261Y8L9_9FUNG|nr:hypothetical protein BZG36_00117 [Bifiguratus adelaidae]